MVDAPAVLLSVRRIARSFVSRRDFLGRPRDVVNAVNEVSFDVAPGHTLGIVGESGSGKSTLGRLALRLIEADRGDIRFEGRDLRRMPGPELRRAHAAMTVIFQDPYSALDPRWTVERIVAEPLQVSGGINRSARREVVAAALSSVGLEPSVMGRRPRAFSGGQRQRIVIARALVTKPRLVFCDEPVSGLDVSTRAQVLELLRELKIKDNLAYLFVSHDLGVVEAISDEIAVMYLGSMVETGPAADVARRYRHPYTAALVSASPAPNPAAQRARRRVVLTGDPPSPVDVPSGCPFHPRCPLAMPVCSQVKPALEIGPDGHGVACHAAKEDASVRGPLLLARIAELVRAPGATATPPHPPSQMFRTRSTIDERTTL
jgi:oligopeptide transport system ATP-binding protein